MKYLKASLLEKDFLENYFCSFENGLLGCSRSFFQEEKPRRPMPISVFFKSQCPKIMVLSKALKAKLSSIPSGIASLSMPASIGTEAEKSLPPLRAFVRPPAMATAHARPHWRASLGIYGVVHAKF